MANDSMADYILPDPEPIEGDPNYKSIITAFEKDFPHTLDDLQVSVQEVPQRFFVARINNGIILPTLIGRLIEFNDGSGLICIGLALVDIKGAETTVWPVLKTTLDREVINGVSFRINSYSLDSGSSTLYRVLVAPAAPPEA